MSSNAFFSSSSYLRSLTSRAVLSFRNSFIASSIRADFKNTSHTLFFKCAHYYIVGNQFTVQLEGEKVEQLELYVAGKSG